MAEVLTKCSKKKILNVNILYESLRRSITALWHYYRMTTIYDFEFVKKGSMFDVGVVSP